MTERLAPVTYLPGITPRTTADDERPARIGAVLGELGDDTTAWAVPVIGSGGEEALRTAEQLEADAAAEQLADEEREAGRIAGDEKAAKRAERVAMHALTRRGMSRREVERTLRSRDLDDDAVAAELERLESVGLVDDSALAQDLVARLQDRKGLGRSAIAAELTRRLIAPAAIEYALDLVDTGDELARAREIAVKRAGQLGSLDREAAVRRLTAYLARRGYSGSTARAAVDAALPQNRSRVRFE